jgi:hypothetical protein
VHGASIGGELGAWARAHLAGRAALDVGAELLSQSAVPRRELALLLARCTGLRTLSWGECVLLILGALSWGGCTCGQWHARRRRRGCRPSPCTLTPTHLDRSGSGRRRRQQGGAAGGPRRCTLMRSPARWRPGPGQVN